MKTKEISALPRFINSARHRMNKFAYHAYTIWLFTRSDLKTIFIPTTIFAIVNYLALPAYGLNHHVDATVFSLVKRLPLVIFWIWIHLLSFTTNNQRSPESIREDALNKPWRPLPARRLSPATARSIGIVVCISTTLVSLFVTSGGWRQSLAGVLLTVWYNRWGGSEVGPFTRNIITAWGYVCFTSGSLEVACGRPLPLSSSNARLALWLMVLGGVITTTMHTQDLEDQEGDRQRGRRTAPIVWGDAHCRWSIALPMLCWGIFCPWIWGATTLMTILTCTLAFTVACRTLLLRTISADRVTFWVWNAWVSSLYVLPLFSSYSSVVIR